MIISSDCKTKAINRFKTLEQEFNSIHNHKYNYDNALYVSTKIKIQIICPKHGVFYQIPKDHLKGCGCPKCGGNHNKTTTEFIDEAMLLHNKYDYSLVEYKNNKTKVAIVCKLHGVFNQTPHEHLQGKGCSTCGNIIKRKNLLSKPTRLYVIKITKESRECVFKIGVTTQTIAERFSKDTTNCIEAIYEHLFNTGVEAYNIEQYLLNKFIKFKYVGPNIISSGNSELFTHDISKDVINFIKSINDIKDKNDTD